MQSVGGPSRSAIATSVRIVMATRGVYTVKKIAEAIHSHDTQIGRYFNLRYDFPQQILDAIAKALSTSTTRIIDLAKRIDESGADEVLWPSGQERPTPETPTDAQLDFFLKDLYRRLKETGQPVGLLEGGLGGTSIERRLKLVEEKLAAIETEPESQASDYEDALGE